ncbi:zf-HC2 domain-containing protein [Streptomyces sp. NPDC051243]|uniref:zf-HC2 domain-containing protein n=1 Tax=Streptomyces sp. NPDC051243 TaxID=3365646 RepID=UPI00378D7A8E
MTGWHASDALVTRYANGSLPEPDAWSLEKHLESCGSCAARASRAVRETPAGVVLAEVRETVLRASEREAAADTSAAAPSRPLRRARFRVSRPLTSTPIGSRTARALWAAGPAVRGAWSASVLGVALAAVLLARFADFAGARPLLLAVAPAVPVAGVALSYGAHSDPLHEIAAATPSAGIRLVLTRTAAVLAVSLPLLTVAGALLPSSGAPAAAAWLLPGLALTLVSLALAGYLGFRAATAVTGGGWLCAVLAPVLTADGRLTARLAGQVSAYLDGAPAQGGWAATAVLCAALLIARRSAYDRLDRR